MTEKIDVQYDYDGIVDILDEILGHSKNHNEFSGQISYDCPVCSHEIKRLDKGDGKGNLEINYKLSVYKCWACGESHRTRGGLRYFIKKYGTRSHLRKYDTLCPDEINLLKKEYKPVYLPKEFKLFNSVSDGFKLTHHYKQAYNYLKSRNITDDMIHRYRIGFCYDGEYANRIIIPSYDADFELNYFIGRSYEAKPYLKYKNPEAEKEKIIWNERLIIWEEPIFLVEGPFDSIFLPNSIPMLGKKMSELLFSKLYDNAENIIIVLDGDAFNDAINLYNKLNGGRLFGKIWIIQLPEDKDIADLKGILDDFEVKQLY